VNRQEQHDLRILGEAIGTLREQHGLTADELAAAAGATPASIVALEHGQLDPSFDLLIRLAEGMGIRPSVLFVRAEELDRRGGDGDHRQGR
jgi:transcriptional regulator with XRE-family HTH domain